MATWYWTYHINIWSTIGKFFGIHLGEKEKLYEICQNIAEFIEKKYEVKVMTREGLKAMPERTEIFSRGYGASVTKGEFCCWEDASIERDIWDVDAYELMNALNVEKLMTCSLL